MFISSIADIARLPLVEDRNISLAKPPLLAFFEGGENVLSGEFIHGVWAEVQDHGDLPTVQQLLFSFQHRTPCADDLQLGLDQKIFLSNKFTRACQGKR